MPFDSEGVFSRLHNWEDDRINDIDIVTDHMDEEDDNFADGLSQCFLKKGTSKMEGTFNVGNFKITNLADGTQARGCEAPACRQERVTDLFWVDKQVRHWEFQVVVWSHG